MSELRIKPAMAVGKRICHICIGKPKRKCGICIYSIYVAALRMVPLGKRICLIYIGKPKCKYGICIEVLFSFDQTELHMCRAPSLDYENTLFTCDHAEASQSTWTRGQR